MRGLCGELECCSEMKLRRYASPGNVPRAHGYGSCMGPSGKRNDSFVTACTRQPGCNSSNYQDLNCSARRPIIKTYQIGGSVMIMINLSRSPQYLNMLLSTARAILVGPAICPAQLLSRGYNGIGDSNTERQST